MIHTLIYFKVLLIYFSSESKRTELKKESILQQLETKEQSKNKLTVSDGYCIVYLGNHSQNIVLLSSCKISFNNSFII